MSLAADIIIKLFWPFLPIRARMAITSRVQAAQQRAGYDIPCSEVRVFSWNKSLAKLFNAELVVDDAAFALEKPVSLIATSKNERANIIEWLESIKNQSRVPDQVIICDAASTDGTVEEIKSWYAAQARKPFFLDLIVEKGANIARGRNIAIERAANEIILATDLGCKLSPEWAERILTPYSHIPELDMSMGYYDVKASSNWARAFLHFLNAKLETVNPDKFLPSGRSVSFTKSAWLRAGKYPEDLTFAGEDTLFDIQLKETSKSLAFVPEAIVSWYMPEKYWSLAKMVHRYSRGDAEGGKMAWAHYLWLLGQTLRFGIEKIGALLFLVLFIIWPNWFNGLFLAFFAGSFFFRLVQVLARYRPLDDVEGLSFGDKCRRVVAALSMMDAQISGFSMGVLGRRGLLS